MNTTRKEAIVCAGLTKRYTSGKETLTAVDGLDLSVAKGEAFAQGVILQYFKTDDDSACSVRNGGFGSTNKN